MAGTIQLGDMGDYVNQQMEKLLRVVVLDVDARLKMESPVDTGRFRASWQVGENSAGTYDAGPQQSPSNLGRDKTSAPADPMFPLRKMNYQQERIGNVYSVHNNLPYATPLANGHSKQAAPGWVQAIAKDAQAYAKAQAAKIGRES
jgi:hypothetical protein